MRSPHRPLRAASQPLVPPVPSRARDAAAARQGAVSRRAVAGGTAAVARPRALTPPLALVAALLPTGFVTAACGEGDAAPTLDAGPADGLAPDATAPAGGVDAGPPPPARPASRPYRAHVDPFIGTGGLGFSVGSAYPGPQTPWGMVKPSPDTMGESGAPGFYHCAGYYADDPYVFGFSHTRMHGVGIVDHGVIAVMPHAGMDASKRTREGRRLRKEPGEEQASPGYYRVRFEGGIQAELTATDRVGVHRYTFPAGSAQTLIFDLGHTVGGVGPTSRDVTIVDARVDVDAAARELRGFVHFRGGYSGREGGLPVYFVARTGRPIGGGGSWQGETLTTGGTFATGQDGGVWIEFDPEGGTAVELAVAISYVDIDHAALNLAAEQATIDFDATRAAAEARWERHLERVEIEGRTDADFEMFYTALYHLALMPTLLSDVDGAYRGMDRQVHVLPPGERYYSDFSLWDTYRTLHPLLALLYPEAQADFLRSMVHMVEDGGHVDKWPLADVYTGGMVGESAAIVFADSWAKGLRDPSIDYETAYDSLRDTALTGPRHGSRYGGRGRELAPYLELGYVPMDEHEGSASTTLEYAYDDWALARLAEGLGRSEDVAMFDARGGNWRHLLDPETLRLVGRTRAGTFARGFSETAWQDFYVEGNVFQYTFFVPHDIEGMAAAMGGRDAVLARLDDLFERSARRRRTIAPDPFYWHGNEPDLHYAFIYAALDRPEGTQRWSRWIVDTRYGVGPDGLPGNDDAGTMSAWLAYAMAGFYTIAGRDDYLVGSPVLTRVTMHLPGGDFVVEAPEASSRAIYIAGATLDGVPLTRPRFSHAAVARGAALRLDMSEAPSAWGRGP